MTASAWKFRLSSTIPTNISTEPDRVYSTYFRAAYWRSGPGPHNLSRKYVGISINSQNTKNRMRSRETNTPTMVPSSASKAMK